jgi:hypothetical protein
MRWWCAALDGGTRTRAPTIASAATGTLIRNVDDQGPGRDGESGGGGPQGDRLRPLRAREGRGEQGERRGHDQGGADAHHGTGRDDPGGAVDERARYRAPAEHDEPEDERPAPAVLVADRAEQQHQRGVRDGVAVDDPLQVRAGQAQVLGHVRGRDGEGGVRHHDDQQAQAEHQQRPPAPGVGPVHPLDRFVHDETHDYGRPFSSLHLHIGVQLHNHVQCIEMHNAVQIKEVEPLWRARVITSRGSGGVQNGSHDHG